ncbi:MAG: hypothetical protein ACK2UI_03245, partial [Anaerolineae bacterium]
NEAYCTANPGVEYGVFFPDGGNVQLDVSAAGDKALTLRWLDIRQSRWSGPKTVSADEGGLLHLRTPTEEGYWAALVQ